MKLPRWAKAGPVVAGLVVIAVVLGYGAIGAAVHLFDLRPLRSGASESFRTIGAPESRAEASAEQRRPDDSGPDPEALCAEARANPAAFDISYYGGADDVELANLQRLIPSRVSRQWTVNAFGEPCAGVDLWSARVALPPGWNGPPEIVLPAAEGVQFQLPDGRHVLLNPVLNGNVLSASFVASLVSSDGQPMSPAVLMPTGQNRGYHGRLYTPRQQPLGAIHVWLDAGGTWQGHTISWVGVTDFAGSTPRDVGSFLSSRSCPEGECTPFVLSSVEYSGSGPDELTLTWSLEGARTLAATYVLHDGRYRLQSGQSPEL